MKLAALLVGMCLLAGSAAAQPVFTIGPSNIANTWGNPQSFSTLTSVGAGSGIGSLLVNGGNGTGDGPQIVFENAGTARGYMGAYSSIFGGSFNFVLAIANGGSGIDLAFEPLEVGSPTGGMPSAGSVNISGVYQVNGTAGVTCSGAPTGSFASVGGVVTHC